MSKKGSSNAIRDIAETLARPAPSEVAKWPTFKEIRLTAKKTEKDDDCGIEDARVRRHLDKLGLNGAVAAYVSALKSTAAPDGAAKSEKDADIDADSAMSEEDCAKRAAVLDKRIRIGYSVPAYLRGYCEEIVNDLAHVGIAAALAANRKIVLDSHIFEENGFFLKNAQFAPLFRNLPSFIAASEKWCTYAKNMHAAETASTYLAEFSRYISDTGTDKFKAIRKNIDEFINESTCDEDEPEEKEDARFEFYIKRMLRTIRLSDERFAALRFSKRINPLIDNILAEFIQLVAMRAIVHIQATGAETVSEAIIRAVILGMMATPSALDERVITHVAMEHIMAIPSADGGIKRAERDEMVAQIAVPKFIRFIDELYPLGTHKTEKAATKGAKPATTDKGAEKPAATDKSTGKPDVAEKSAEKPAATDKSAGKPDVAEKSAEKPAATDKSAKPAATADKIAAEKPAADKSAAPKPAVDKRPRATK